jgi:hypothetical protein
MQSSTVVALRGMMMVMSLLAIPLAAVIGTGCWPRAIELLDALRCDLVAQCHAGLAAPGQAGPQQPPKTDAKQPIQPLPFTGSPPVTPLTVAASAPRAQPAPAEPPARARVDSQVTPAVFAGPTAVTHAVEPAKPPQPADVLSWIRHRLETLGAVYYRLETAGPRGEMYRFQCKMVSPVNPNYVRYFEATAGEPQRAMQHVLDQVDAWVSRGDGG